MGYSRIFHKIYFCIFIFLQSNIGITQTRPQRPKILGIAHVAIFISNNSTAIPFYRGLLGFDIPFALKDSKGKPWISYVKINDNQYFELFTTDDPAKYGEFSHIALYTDNLPGMQSYLEAQKVKIVEPAHVGRNGNSFLAIHDPEDNLVEIVQYQSGSWTDGANRKFVPAVRIADHIDHVGMLVFALGPMGNFYRNIFGFQEIRTRTHQGGDGSRWRVPDGNDYLEFLPHRAHLKADRVRSEEYISLTTPDIQKSLSDLLPRARHYAFRISPLPNKAPIGLDLFDSDGTRIEVMSR